ncbi:phosphoribosyltransferase family protein [Salibacterium aidingense]|uniref:phosphoribosyltransferase family protein n=1 Tax=Salibacterium aidingense TaxID=384933 RepID=UPI00041FD0FE|nr:phosphoribosyltransferase family protein [Salibacterium aidingense]
MSTYTLHLGGVTRELPIIAVSDEVSIASFVILGDTEIVQTAAPLLADKLPPVDMLVTAEAKGIPFVYELSKQLGMKRYIVARKSVKPYMKNPIVDKASSITTQKEQQLVLEERDAALLEGKRIALVDDVISTGESLLALEKLVTRAGGNVMTKAAILAEGNAAAMEDITFLETLPLFKKE